MPLPAVPALFGSHVGHLTTRWPAACPEAAYQEIQKPPANGSLNLASTTALGYGASVSARNPPQPGYAALRGPAWACAAKWACR